MKPLFERIEVKTIDDLPKEDMLIYGKYKRSVILEAIEFHKNDLQWGIANIDWYFKPVSEEEVQNELCIYPRIVR
jgi:hypothetical protein